MDLDFTFKFDEKVFYLQGYYVMVICLFMIINDIAVLLMTFKRY